MRLSSQLILLLSIVLSVLTVHRSEAQYGYWGFQASPGFSTQKWNNSSRDALLTIGGDFFMSIYGENDETNVYYAKAGYHQRGSSVNISSFSGLVNNRLKYVFHNVTIGAGVQKHLTEKFNLPFYYLLGVRLEYTVATNLESFRKFNSPFYPHKNFVNKFNYGLDFGGGFVFHFLEGYDVFLELLISPDFSLQYEQDPIKNVINPYHPAQTIDLGKRQVRNLSFELSVGLRMDQ